MQIEDGIDFQDKLPEFYHVYSTEADINKTYRYIDCRAHRFSKKYDRAQDSVRFYEGIYNYMEQKEVKFEYYSNNPEIT